MSNKLKAKRKGIVPQKHLRKPRGIKLNGQRSLNMCSCFAFNCDPMAMSPLFSAKVERKLANGGCGACGQRPCKCKSSIRAGIRKNPNAGIPLIESKFYYIGVDTESYKNGKVYRVVETGEHWNKEYGFVIWVATEEDKHTKDIDLCASFSVEDFHNLFWRE